MLRHWNMVELIFDTGLSDPKGHVFSTAPWVEVEKYIKRPKKAEEDED